MTPYDFNTEGNFTTHVDLSMAGQVQDCAECHVGGGAMEYVPNPVMANRVPLRKIYEVEVNGFGSIMDTNNFTAFNYFIDTYDVNNDGNRTMALEMDWRNNGVLEMDCLLCHLEGYDYHARIHMLREARFDASRAVGAGVAAPNTAILWDTNGTAPSGYGTTVVYNDMVTVNATTGYLQFSGGLQGNNTITSNIKAAPPSENCAFCHANFPGVDWKKRGDSWRNERTDAHWVLQCMGCHEGKVGSVIGTSGDASSPDLGQCDPAKGVARYSGLQNAKDASIKTCEDCHLRAGYDSTLQEYSPDYGAPDPTGTHEYYGLTSLLCQSDTNSTTPNVQDRSHIDVIGCAACHIRKLPDDAWNTAGAVVDASGEDWEGRMADHENIYVQRAIKENLVYQWQYGKVIPTSVLTTLYWRDVDNGFDANADGYVGGSIQDPPLTTHILGINNDGRTWTCMTRDEGNGLSSVIDSTVLAERISALNSELGAYTGNATGTADIKLCPLSVPFIVTHNVSPASYALGHACSDCHSAGSNGLWNGNYELMGDKMALKHSAGQMVKFTAKNSPAQLTDFHYNLRNRPDTRVIAIQPISDDGDNATTITRWQTLYEADLTYGGNFTGVDNIVYKGGAAWRDYLNTVNATTCSCYPDANASVCSGNFTAQGFRGYGIGINCDNCSSSSCFPTTGLSTYTGICYKVWGSVPAEKIWNIYEVKVCTPICFEADPLDVSCGAEYYWNINDASGFYPGTQFSAIGQKVSHEFRKLGIVKVVLTVKNLYGNVDSEMILVNVVK